MSTSQRQQPARLVDYLQEWKPPVVSRPAAQLAIAPKRLREAAAAVDRRLGDVALRPPSPLDLAAIGRELEGAWSSRGSLTGLSPRVLRMAPWVFFFGQDPRRWVGRNHELVEAWLAWLRWQPRPQPILSLLRAYLQDYPRELPVFEAIRRDLRLHLEQGTGPRLERWRERCERFGLLEADGPRALLRAWWEVDVSFESYLTEAGLAPGLESSAFVRLATEHLLCDLETSLRRACTLARLRRGLAWIEGDAGRLRFDSLRIPTAKALLGPFLEQAPDAAIQAALSEFLRHAIGDPRSQRPKWQGIPDEIRNVLLRWLVSESIDVFLQIVRDTAKEQHWRYREAFWRAYLEHKVIQDAWVVLGAAAARLLRKEFASVGASARLSGANVQGTHSVLLMRIADLIIADWSHDGACRIWREGDRSAPRLYEATYQRERLIARSRFKQAHVRSEHGYWQQSVHDWIADQTGIRIPRSEYMPQRRGRR